MCRRRARAARFAGPGFSSPGPPRSSTCWFGRFGPGVASRARQSVWFGFGRGKPGPAGRAGRARHGSEPGPAGARAGLGLARRPTKQIVSHPISPTRPRRPQLRAGPGKGGLYWSWLPLARPRATAGDPAAAKPAATYDQPASPRAREPASPRARDATRSPRWPSSAGFAAVGSMPRSRASRPPRATGVAPAASACHEREWRHRRWRQQQ